MTMSVLIGALLGAVVFGLIVYLFPPRVTPLVQLARFDSRREPAEKSTGFTPDGAAAANRLGAALIKALESRGFGFRSLRQDLALTGKTFQATMARKVVLFVFGSLLALSATVGLVFTGLVPLPAGSPILIGLAGGGVFFMLPDIDAKTAAAARRAEFRHAFATFLDLVVLEMAALAAPAEALPSAAKVGAGWPIAVLRYTLFKATLVDSQAQWMALRDLGDRIGVEELRDLGQVVQLVAHDGARVRETITARAAAMRQRLLADAVGVAGERDQSMRLAQILIGFGFIVFLGYPAVVNIMGV
jgi:tight adherence protein C